MIKRFAGRLTSIIICAVFVVQLASCGTLLYPERQGQRSGQIDIAVVLMDGIGLFFFIIPGVIAFAVDFSTGAIYLPPGHERNIKISKESGSGIRTIRMDPKKMDADTIERYVEVYTGHRIRFNESPLLAIKADNDPELNVGRELIRLEAYYHNL